MAASGGQTVTLLVYDLSQGMAQQFAAMMPGIPRIVPHTSVVVGGKEWYFGGSTGIEHCVPGTAPYGRPVQQLPMGITQLSDEDIREIIASLEPEYTAQSYSLLDHNCNNFSNDFCGFITGQTIPKWILSAPDDFMATPMGQSLRPMIDQMYTRPVTQSNGSKLDAGEAVPQLAQAATSKIQAQERQLANGSNGSSENPVTLISSLSAFQSILKSTAVVVAFFTSSSCPPCKLVAPTFQDLAWKHTSPSSKGRTAFLKIDLSGSGQQIGQTMSVRATPTFVFWHHGKETNRFSGADQKRLATDTELELMAAFPSHPHTKIQTPELYRISLKPIIFDSQPKSLDPVFQKLGEFLAVQQSDTRVRAMKSILKDKCDYAQVLPCLSDLSAMMDELPHEHLFPVFDLLRLAMLSTNSSHVVKALQSGLMSSFITRIDKLNLEHSERFDASKLTSLKMLCNLFANDDLAQELIGRSKQLQSTSYAEKLVNLVRTSLSSHNYKVRQAASSICFNMAERVGRPARAKNALHAERLHARAGLAYGLSNEELTSEGFVDEEFVVELASMINEALDGPAKSQENMIDQSEAQTEHSSVESAEDLDVYYRLIASLGCLLHLTPLTSLQELLTILGTPAKLERIRQNSGRQSDRDLASKVARLASEIILLCSADA